MLRFLIQHHPYGERTSGENLPIVGLLRPILSGVGASDKTGAVQSSEMGTLLGGTQRYRRMQWTRECRTTTAMFRIVVHLVPSAMPAWSAVSRQSNDGRVLTSSTAEKPIRGGAGSMG